MFNQYTVKIDMSHLLSKEQIEVVKDCTHCGEEISFQKYDDQITGTVKKKYENIFTLEDGRSFTWIEYVIGSPEILNYLRMFHPIEMVRRDNNINYYRAKAMRVN